MGVNASLEGLGDAIERLELKVGNAAKIENDALLEAAAPILDEAKATSAFHDRTGILRGSLKIGSVRTDKRGRKYTLVMATSPHAHLIEFGHGGHSAAAHPFLEPAFNHHREEAIQIIAARIREALKG